jgi:hypothetical protein
MSPHFARKDTDDPGTATTQRLQAEVERLEALALPHLAAEVMRAAFTTDYAPDLTPLPPTEWIFVPADLKNTRVDMPPELAMRLRDLAAEGMQLLEHNRLVRVEAHHAGTSFTHGYLTTRLGRQALASGTLEQILAGS